MSFISVDGRKRLQQVQEWLAGGAQHVEIERDGVKLPPLTRFSIHQTVRRDDCGTVCCIAGAVCQFNAPFDIRDFDNHQWVKFYKEESEHHDGVSAIAQGLLGISLEDATDLFEPSGIDWDDITPAVAAELLRAYLETGKIDWYSAKEVIENKEANE